MISFEGLLALIVAASGALAVTTARRGAWVALAALVAAATLLEYRPTTGLPIGLVARVAAVGAALSFTLPAGLFDRDGLRRDLAPRNLAIAFAAHPVASASAAAGLVLGAIPLALPIEAASAPARAAGVALLLVGIPPLLTSRYVEATSRAAIVAISGTLLLRASILGPLDPAAAVAVAGGLAVVLVVGSFVADTIAAADEGA